MKILKEAENKLPYDVLVDTLNGKRQKKNKAPWNFTSLVKGLPFNYEFVHKNSDGSVMFKISADVEKGVATSTLAYDSVQEAKKDGWNI